MSITQQELRPALPEDATLAPTLSFIEGRWVKGRTSVPVLDKYTGEVFAEVSALRGTGGTSGDCRTQGRHRRSPTAACSCRGFEKMRRVGG